MFGSKKKPDIMRFKHYSGFAHQFLALLALSFWELATGWPAHASHQPCLSLHVWKIGQPALSYRMAQSNQNPFRNELVLLD